MSNFLAAYYIVFGVLAIVGGVIGFVKAKSVASIVAGGVSGLLLIAGGVFIATGSLKVGLMNGLIVSFILALRFVPIFVKTRAWMPAGLMSILSVIGLLLGVAALLG